MFADSCSSCDFMEQYEIEETIRFIRENQFHKVCLQFPDHLLSDAPKVVDELKRRMDAEFYVLGDTAYAPCCVDIVAAQHVEAHAIIHYGHACLSPTRDLPVYYVFEKKYLKHMEKLVQLLEETSAPYLVVLFESYYGHLRNQLFNFLGSHIKQKTIIPVYFCQSSKVDDLENELQNETKSRKYTIGHLEFELDSSVPRDQLQFVWLGNPDSSSFLRASLSLYPYVLDCYDDSTDSWIPAEGCALTTFKRRLRLISKSQNSCVFGIVVSAIATKGVLDAVERCEMLLDKFEKEWYLLNVGKPTPTKLANFAEIEVFVFIGCPESAFLDSKNYMKPIITLAELEMALDPSLYYTDIGFIHDFRDSLVRPVAAKQESSDDREVDHSYAEESRNALSKLGLDRNLATYDISSSSSATFLKRRSWKGVEEQLIGEEEPHAAKEGRCGIPRGYSNEGSSFSAK